MSMIAEPPALDVEDDEDDLPPRVHRVPLWLVLLVLGCCGVVTAFALAVAFGVVQLNDRTDLQGTVVEIGGVAETRGAQLEAAGIVPAATIAPSLASSITSAADALSTPAPVLTTTFTAVSTTTFPGPARPPVTITGPGGVVTVTAPGATVTAPGSVSTSWITGGTVTETATQVVEVPGPVTTVEVPVEVPGPIVTVTAPAETVTVTVTADPPPDPGGEPPTDQPTDNGE